MFSQVINERWIALVKVQKIIRAFLQASSRKQNFLYFVDLSELVGLASLFRPKHFVLNLFKTDQCTFRRGCNIWPERWINAFGPRFNCAEHLIHCGSLLCNRKIMS